MSKYWLRHVERTDRVNDQRFRKLLDSVEVHIRLTITMHTMLEFEVEMRRAALGETLTLQFLGLKQQGFYNRRALRTQCTQKFQNG